MKKTAELFTPQETESHLWQKKQRALKHLKVLLLVPLKVNDKMPNVRLIKDQLRYLVKEVLVIKYQHKLDEYINRFQPDLILALGSETVFPEENLAALRTSTVPKAIWMADAAGLSIIERKLALLFDYIFTQNVSNLFYYEGLLGKHSSYLSYVADTDIYFPRRVESRFKSDILILGDFSKNNLLQSLAQSQWLTDLKVIGYGNGVENFSDFIPLTSSKHLSSYYNGTRMVINFSGSLQQVMEVSACGIFQLTQEHPNLKGYLSAPNGLISFTTFNQLTDFINYYSSHSDERRLAASLALEKNKYNYSYMQQGLLLLNTIFE